MNNSTTLKIIINAEQERKVNGSEFSLVGKIHILHANLLPSSSVRGRGQKQRIVN